MYYEFVGNANSPIELNAAAPLLQLAGGLRLDPRRLMIGGYPEVGSQDILFARHLPRCLDFPQEQNDLEALAQDALELLKQGNSPALRGGNFWRAKIFDLAAPSVLRLNLDRRDAGLLSQAREKSPLLSDRVSSEFIGLQSQLFDPIRDLNRIKMLPIEFLTLEDEHFAAIDRYLAGQELAPVRFRNALGRACPVGDPSYDTGNSLRVLNAKRYELFLTSFMQQIAPKVTARNVANAYSANFPVAVSRSYASPVFNYELKSLFQFNGKGSSSNAAMVSLAGETIERFSALHGLNLNKHHQDLLSARGRYNELPSSPKGTGRRVSQDRGIRPDHIGGIGKYQGHEVLNWTAAESMVNGSRFWVPTQAVLFDVVTGDEPETGIATTNGLAAGTTLEDAKLQALLEISERHATHTGWWGLKDVFKLADCADDSELTSMLSSCQSQGIDVNFINVTGDQGVPCFIAATRLEDDSALAGYGAHLSSRIAIKRALTEMLSSSDLHRDENGQLIKSQPFLPDNHITKKFKTPRINLNQLPELSSGTVAGDLAHLVTHYFKNGMEPVFCDITNPELGLNTVRVIVPGISTPYWLTVTEAANLFASYKALK